MVRPRSKDHFSALSSLKKWSFSGSNNSISGDQTHYSMHKLVQMTLLLHISIVKSWCFPEMTPLAPREWRRGHGFTFRVFLNTDLRAGYLQNSLMESFQICVEGCARVSLHDYESQ